MAEILLKRAQARIEAATGETLDVGEFPEPSEGPLEDDPQLVTKLLAHAIARLADRFTFLRRFSRHLEGSERKAGILADAASAAMALYKRNPILVERLVTSLVSEFQQRRNAAKSSKQSSATQTGGVTSAES